ncbi:hypothetical protein GGI35DRAFT_490387 [Trichoderma velutinum]
MANWLQLPLEIKLTIWKFLAADPGGNPRKPAQNKKSGLAGYACVSKQWQDFFESILYARLTLSQYCLQDFRVLMHRQRDMVRYLWLRFRLTPYDCFTCSHWMPTPSQNGEIVRLATAVGQLFHILSQWELHGSGIAFEISATNPCDLEHHFKGNIYLDANSEEIEDMRTNGVPHDLAHGWWNGQLVTLPPQAALAKLELLCSRAMQTRFQLSVPVITGLVLRRTTRCVIRPALFEVILACLPNLRHFTYEIWRVNTSFESEYMWDMYYRFIVKICLPKSLESFTIFEDFNEVFNRIHASSRANPSSELIRTPSSSISFELANRSQALEKVSASYLVDAVQFFGHINDNWTWDRLTSLSLTCQLLNDSANWEQIVELLSKVGIICQRMPKLRLLNIWHGMKGTACAFKYRRLDHRAVIVWCGTWELTIERNIVRAWQKVALLHIGFGACILVGSYQRLNPDDIRSHAAAIRLLGLAEQVIHPASLEEIDRESDLYTLPHDWRTQLA